MGHGIADKHVPKTKSKSPISCFYSSGRERETEVNNTTHQQKLEEERKGDDRWYRGGGGRTTHKEFSQKLLVLAIDQKKKREIALKKFQLISKEGGGSGIFHEREREAKTQGGPRGG